MRILVILAMGLVLGCETAPPKKVVERPNLSGADQAVKPASEIYFEKKEESYTLTGRSVFIETGRLISKNCFTSTEIAEIKNATAAILAKQGFKVVSQARKAHSLLALLCDEHLGDDKTTSDSHAPVETTETRSSYKDGKFVTETRKYRSGGDWRRFAYGWVTNEYGRRERTAFTLAVTTEKSKWDGLKPAIRKRALDELAALNLKVPADDLKMAGDPACQPRFGFLAESQVRDGKTVFVVTEVLPGSPAKAAGMRLGDLVLAIDSVEYSHTSPGEEVYEAKTPVPLKLSRNGKVIRSSLTPKILCP